MASTNFPKMISEVRRNILINKQCLLIYDLCVPKFEEMVDYCYCNFGESALINPYYELKNGLVYARTSIWAVSWDNALNAYIFWFKNLSDQMIFKLVYFDDNNIIKIKI